MDFSKNHNIIYKEVELGENIQIGHFNTIGCPKEISVIQNCVSDITGEETTTTKIGNNCIIANNIVIYKGATIGNRVKIDDFVRVGSNTKIGDETLLLYGALIYNNVKIGINCKISGFIPNNSIIGDNVSMMGQMVHRYPKPLDWDNKDDSPFIEDSVVVGFNATIIGGITLGKNSYIAANATVNKNVPPDTIVINTNEFIPFDKWTGRMEEYFNK